MAAATSMSGSPRHGDSQGNYSCQNPDGCLALISTGISAFDSTLLSASSDGTDVSFFTRDKLVAQGETGNFVKLYDARELGGFPISPAPVPCKASDECHGPGTPPPPAPNIHLNTGKAGNRVPGSCGSGFRKKHGKWREKACGAAGERVTTDGGTVMARHHRNLRHRWPDIVAIACLLGAVMLTSAARASEAIESFTTTSSTTQAGGHPDLETSFSLASPGLPEAARNVIFNAPRGTSETPRPSNSARPFLCP